MSCYKTIKCSLVNKEILIESLEALRLKPQVHETAQQLQGWEGDSRKQTAEIIVSRKQLDSNFTGESNDLGFKWNDKTNKYDMICSDYDIACQLPSRVKQAYAKIAIEKALIDNKFKIKVSTPNEQLQQKRRSKVKIVASRVI